MKLTKSDEGSCTDGGSLIVERSLRPKKEPETAEDTDSEHTTMRQPEMTEDNSVVSAYQEGRGEEQKEFEKKMLLRRQEAERKMNINKNNKDVSVDSLIEGVKDFSISKNDGKKIGTDELSGKLSQLSLKRQEPREDDERGNDGPRAEDEAKAENVVHDQRWAALEEPTQEEEPTDEETDDKKKKVVQKRGPMGGVAVFSERSVANGDFGHQQMTLNDSNALAWHQQQLKQQQQALTMPHNFPNYQNFQPHQQAEPQYNQGQGGHGHAVANIGTGLGPGHHHPQPHHHSKRGFDYEVQDMHCGEAPKYYRPQQMPQNNLDAPGMPLSPTSFNKSVSTVCTKQMAGATLLQQNSPATAMLSPTQQQQQQQHQIWNNQDYSLQQQQLLQQRHNHQHPQQQQQQHNLQQGFLPPDYPTNDLGSDLTFLDEALNNADVVCGVDDDRDFERLLDKALAVHKGQDDATVLQKDLEPILSNGFAPQHPQQYLPNMPSPPAVPIENNANKSAALGNAPMIRQHRNSQEDTGYATDQSPSHEFSQYSPGPQSVMEASPAASSGIGTPPPPHFNFWSPPPSNLSELSQDSGVCSPMSEDGKANGGQDASQQQVESLGRGYIVPPVQDPLSRLIEDEAGDDQYLDSFVDAHLEDLNDAVSVLTKDVQQSLLQQSQIPSPQEQQTQPSSSQQQLQQQNHNIHYHQQQQQHQQQLQEQLLLQQQQQQQQIASSGCVMGVRGQQQVQQTTNLANGSGGVMVNNCPPAMPQAAQPPPPPPALPTTSAIPQAPPGLPSSINNNKMIPAASIISANAAATTPMATTTTPAINGNQQQQPQQQQHPPTTALVFTSSTTTPTTMPPPNAQGKLPLPPMPRRSPNMPQGSAPMIPAVGFPNNGQMTALIIIPQQKPRFPNIAPKDPTRQNADATNGTVNATTTSTTTTTNNNNNNRVTTTTCPRNTSPPVMQSPPMAANGSNANNIANSPANPVNGNAQNIANRTTKKLNYSRRAIALLVREDLEFVDSEGDTNLHIAVCRTDPYLVQAYLERLLRENLPCMINTQNNAGQTPLYLAVSSNDPNKVKVLVDKGADPTLYAETKGYNGANEKMAAIHCAASKGQGYLMTLKALLLAPGVQVDQLDSQGHTALHCAILCHGKTRGDNQQINSLPIIEALVAAGANLNLQVRNGRTALMFALESGSMDLIESLFSLVEPENRQQYLKTQDVKGNTVLKIAERVKALLPPAEQQRLHNCLKKSVQHRNGALLGSPAAAAPVVNGVGNNVGR